MWIGDVFINEKNIVTAEPYVQDCSYGVKINGIPIEIVSTGQKYTKEEKLKITRKIIDLYIRNMESWK